MPEKVVAGRYRLERQLGTGGMSEVWEAEDLELGRMVALKLLAESADRARFDREARSAAALSNPHISQLYDYGEAGGRPYMVLEYLPGGTLEELLAAGNRKPLSDEDALRIAGEVAAGLAHAHSRGVVHRDLKPANVLFDAEGRAKIADFGIARMGGSGTLTEAGTVLGTASYISPEQAAGLPATPASDVYSFGVMLFRMLTGRLPFEAEEPIELVTMHRDAPPPSVSAFRPDAPPRLARLAEACLAKDPHARPLDGAALVAALGGPAYAAEAATAILSMPAAPPPPPQPFRRRRVSRGRLAALVVGLLAAAAAGVAVAVLGGGSSSTPLTSTKTRRTTTHHTTTRPTTTSTPRSTSTTTTRTSPSTTTHPTSTHTTTHPTTTRPASTPPPPPPTTTTLPPTSTTLPVSSSTTVAISTP